MKIKTELYNSMIKFYKNTGEAIPIPMLTNEARQAADLLVEEGLAKIVIKYNSYTPDDIFLCLINQYCVEESFVDRNLKPLMFMRHYKSNGILDPQLRLEYEQWLKDNQASIESVNDLKPLKNTGLDRVVIKFVRDQAFYRRNISLQELVSKFENSGSIINHDKIVGIYKEIITSYEYIGKDDEVKELNTKLKDQLNYMKYFKIFKAWVNEQDFTNTLNIALNK